MNKRRILKLAFALVAVVVALVLGAPRAKRRAESAGCGNYMVSIGCAARLWAQEHGGTFPSDLLSMSNELVSPKILICPGDHSRTRATSWGSFTTRESSYEIVTPGLRESDTNAVFLRCKIHGHLGYADTMVFDGVKRRSKKL